MREYTGEAGSFFTISASNLEAIPVGSKVAYTEAATAAGGLDTDIVVNTPDGETVYGHVVLDGATQTGTVMLTGGTERWQSSTANCRRALEEPSWLGRAVLVIALSRTWLNQPSSLLPREYVGECGYRSPSVQKPPHPASRSITSSEGLGPGQWSCTSSPHAPEHGAKDERDQNGVVQCASNGDEVRDQVNGHRQVRDQPDEQPLVTA